VHCKALIYNLSSLDVQAECRFEQLAGGGAGDRKADDPRGSEGNRRHDRVGSGGTYTTVFDNLSMILPMFNFYLFSIFVAFYGH
jgi:hypothetical protein